MAAPQAGSTTSGGRVRPTLLALHAAAAVVVVLGVLAEVVRPLAPALVPPADAGRWFDAAYRARAAAYHDPRYLVALAGLVLTVTIPLVAAWAPAGRRVIDRLVDRVGAHRPARAAAVVVLAVVVATDVLLLPLTFWAGFVHEGRWGFRTQGLLGWARDWLVAVVPGWLAVVVLALLGWTLARRLPRAWPPVAGLLGTALGAVVVLVAPLVLEPLRFDTVPLQEGAVRDAVEQVLARAGQPVEQIVVADASRRTTKQNAYVSGLGTTRRVVLYDTLVDGQPPDVVAMVLAHELAHDRHADLARSTLLGGAATVAGAYALSALLRRRTRRGRQDAVADPRAAAVVVAIAVMLATVSLPLQALVSRRAEAAADLGSLQLTDDPATFVALHERLAVANLADPDPPWWVYRLWFSHPTPPARLAMGARYR